MPPCCAGEFLDALTRTDVNPRDSGEKGALMGFRFHGLPLRNGV